MHFYNRSNPSYIQSHLEAGWLFCIPTSLPAGGQGTKQFPLYRANNTYRRALNCRWGCYFVLIRSNQTKCIEIMSTD